MPAGSRLGTAAATWHAADPQSLLDRLQLSQELLLPGLQRAELRRCLRGFLHFFR